MEHNRALEDTKSLTARDQHCCWHPYTQAMTAPSPLPVVHAQGTKLHLADGSIVLDAISSWWVNLHGHGHAYIAQRITEQLNRLDQVIFADLTHEPAVALAERLTQVLPGDLQRVFYTDNGSTAVEAALKIAIQYWHNKASNTRRRKVVTFRNGFHGETFGAMAVSSKGLFAEPFLPYLFEVETIDPPTPGKEEASLEQFKRLLATNEVACFIFEPHLQGVGGMVPHSTLVLSELIALAKEQDVITIADEILTGCGRTGPYFACEKLGVFPDIICLAKALTGGTVPFGVTVCAEWLFDGFLSTERQKALLHGHSYCGNPVGCVAALASLDLLMTPECDAQRTTIEEQHSAIAEKWVNDERLRRVDIVGTVLAVEFATEDEGYFSDIRDRLLQFYLNRGVLIRPFGNTVHVIPPYCTTAAQLKKIYAVLEESFAFVTEETRRHASR